MKEVIMAMRTEWQRSKRFKMALRRAEKGQRERAAGHGEIMWLGRH